MPDNTVAIQVGEHCVTVAAGEQWSDPAAGQKDFAATGSALDVRVKVFGHDEALYAEAAAHEEEVATVLEGSFHIQADDEQYELTVGEGIVIPPSSDRVWRCTSQRGVLYRVLTLTQDAGE